MRAIESQSASPRNKYTNFPIIHVHAHKKILTILILTKDRPNQTKSGQSHIIIVVNKPRGHDIYN